MSVDLRHARIRASGAGERDRLGLQLRISAQLTGAEADAHLWFETCDRTLITDHLFEIQDEIAQAIVAAIGSNLGVMVGYAGAPEPTDKDDADALCLRARTRFFARVEPSGAADLHEEAIQLVPVFLDAPAVRGPVFVVGPAYGLPLDDSAEASRAVGRVPIRHAWAIKAQHSRAPGAISLSRCMDRVSDMEGIDATFAGMLSRYERALAAEPNSVDLIKR